MKLFKAIIPILIPIAAYLSCGKSVTREKTPEPSTTSESKPVIDVHDYAVETPAGQPSSFTFTQRPATFSGPSNLFNYTLPYSSVVKLELLNGYEQKIGSTEFGYHKAGSYQFRWNPSSVPSGLYFFNLHACDSIITLRTVLLR